MKIILSILLTLLVAYSFAQTEQPKNYFVAGNVVDSITMKALQYVSVTVLKGDSIIVSTRSSEIGKFSFGILKPGRYDLSFSYVGYDNLNKIIDINGSDKDTLFLNVFKMITMKNILKEVQITGVRSGIKVSGDTTEYDATAFKVDSNATVETLLKKLPNIKIDSKGNISGEGERVKVVLVDGEEFFGSDPSLVIKNLRTDMVKKVQVYNKSSKQAQKSGVDDGVRNKTINIELKSDKRKGRFGKLRLGPGIPKFYQGEALYNIFNDQEKIAFFGIASNNGVVGLAWKEREKIMEQNENKLDELDTWSGTYNGEGRPEVQTVGAHYSNSWSNKKYSINANYRGSHLVIDRERLATTQYNLASGINTMNRNEKANNEGLRNKADINFGIVGKQWEVNTENSVSLEHKKSDELVVQGSTEENGNILNYSRNTNNASTNISSITSVTQLNKKFKKAGRLLSFTFNGYHEQNLSSGNFNSETRVYGPSDSTMSFNQRKSVNGTEAGLGVSGVYQEPLTKNLSLSAISAIKFDEDNSDIKSYNLSSGKAISLDSLNSNTYHYRQSINEAGLALKYVYKKVSFSSSIKYVKLSLIQKDLEKASPGLVREFEYLSNYSRISYSFTNRRFVQMSYNNILVQPELFSIQPIQINNDPLNIYLGNPNLQPSKRQTINFLFRDFLFQRERTLLFSGSLILNSNPIVQSFETSNQGINYISFVNLENSQTTSLNAYILYSEKFRKLGLRLSSNSGVNTNQYLSITNGLVNINKYMIYTFNLGLANLNSERCNISIEWYMKYNKISQSLTANSNRYFDYTLVPTFEYLFPKQFVFKTEGRLFYQQRANLYLGPLKQFVWNTSIEKTFLNNRFSAELVANDILNQNKGFSRSASGNYIQQIANNTISRNIMLVLTYHVNNFKSKL